MNISFQKLFYAIATVLALFAILILAKSILIPLSFALLVSFMLYPLVRKLESWGMNSIIATSLAFCVVILIISGGIFLFSTQIIGLSAEFSNFKDKIILSFTDVTVYINKNVNFVPELGKDELFDRIKTWLSESSGSLVSQTFSSSATFFAGLGAAALYTFLFLIYRKGLIRALTAFAKEDKKDRVINMFRSVQQVGQKYLFGMVILIIVIGLGNSIGLMIIGIDNPFLFGFLGAVLAIIPYVGTIIGAIIPILYAFISSDSLWMPLAVAGLFWFVQLLSDNLLSPKIVGSNININALTAVLSLIVGAAVWGVAGMILFLPFAAMLKIVCEEYEELKPIGLLIGSENYHDNQNKNKFVHKCLDKIKSWFAKFHIHSRK